MHRKLQDILVAPDARIIDVLAAIDRGGYEIALFVDVHGRLLGTMTDGDARRALLRGTDLHAPALEFAAREPYVVSDEVARAQVVDLMRARHIKQVPVVDDERRIVGLHTIDEMLGGPDLPNWAVVMAGGRGTRLGPLTRSTPKPLTPVAGRPILEWIVLNLVGAGVRELFVSVNYLAEQIEAHFGDGSKFGCRIEYLREQPERPLGTAGSLGLLPAEPDHPVLVMNGDLMSTFSVGELLSAHERRGSQVTVAVRDYAHEVPFGVVRCDETGRLREIVEKPLESWPVSTGIYVLHPHVLRSVPTDREFPMTELLRRCIDAGGAVDTWRLVGDWMDVGRPSDLTRARGLV